MKILFLCTFQTTLNASGGIARVTANLCRVFTEQGHSCSMAYLHSVTGQEPGQLCDSVKLEHGLEQEMLMKRFADTDVVIVQVQMTKGFLYLLPILDEFRNKTGASLVYCHHNEPFSEAVGYDFTYLNWLLFHSKNSLSARLFKCAWCLTCILFPKASKKRIARRRQMVASVMDRFVLLSESFLPELMKYVRIDENKVECIGNSMTYSVSEYNETEKENAVLIVANLNEQAKRISRLLRVWELVKRKKGTDNWKLYIVGAGEDYEEYRQIVYRRKLGNCIFEGRQNPLPFYRRSKIMLMASAYEGLPMVIHESQQNGCIPVVSDTWASVRDSISDGKNGIIVSHGGVRGFSDALFDLMTDENRRRSLAANCHISDNRFSEQVIYDKWQALFNSLKNN